MPIYEYQGQQYDISTDDHAEAKSKILSYLDKQSGAKAPVKASSAETPELDAMMNADLEAGAAAAEGQKKKGTSIFENGTKMEPPTVDARKNLEAMRRSGSPESVMFNPGRQLEAVDTQIDRYKIRQEAAKQKAAEKAAQARATLEQRNEEEGYSPVDLAKDIGVGLVGKGGTGLAQSVAGLGDIATGWIPGDETTNPLQLGQWGKMMDKLGVDFDASNKFLTGLQSPRMQLQLDNAEKGDGFFGYVKELGLNPLALIDTVTASIPSIVATGKLGGAVTRMWASKAAAEAVDLGLTGSAAEKFIADKVRNAASIAASAAEGTLGAGSVAEYARSKGVDWDEYILPALGAGVGTALIGIASNKLGAKLGIGDIETDIAARTAGVKGLGVTQGPALTGFFKEIAKEGFLEEMPQSAQEQIFSNLATGRPWDEGVDKAAAQGLMAGLATAGGHNAVMTALQKDSVEAAPMGKPTTSEQERIEPTLELEEKLAITKKSPAQPAPGAEGATNVGQPIDETGGVSTELAGQPNQVAPAGGVGEPTADGVVPAGENVGRTEEGAGTQPAPLTFTTAKGSVYVVGEDGKTSRTKNSQGRGQGTTYEPHTAMYVQPGDHENILNDMRSGMGGNSVRLGYIDNNTFYPVENVADIPEGGQAFVGVFNKKNGTPVGLYPALTTPELGFHPVEKLYTPDGDSNTHIGNAIVDIQPTAPTAQTLPVLQKGEEGMPIQDGAGQPVPMSALTTPEALERTKKVLNTSNPEQELYIAQQRGGLSTAEAEAILGIPPTQQGAQVGTETPKAVKAAKKGQKQKPAAATGVTEQEQKDLTAEEQKELDDALAPIREIFRKSQASTKFKNRGIKQRALEKMNPEELMAWIKSNWRGATKVQREAMARLPSIEYLGTWVKDLGLNQVLEASELMTAMLGKQKVLAEETEQLVHMMQKAFADDPTLADKLSELAYVSTNLEVDPSDPATKRRVKALDADYAALGETGQMLYKMAKQFGVDRADLYLQLLQQNIDDLQIDEEDKKNLMTVLRKQYEASSRITPYFALVRDDGDYWLSVGKGDDKEFYIYDNMLDRDADQARIIKERGISKDDTKTGDSVESLRQATYEASSFLRAVFDAIDAAPTTKKQGTEESTARYKESLKDAVYQTYLNVMPEKSFRGMFKHRKGRAGYRTDLAQNIAATGVKMNSQLAKLKYAQKLRNTVDSAQAAIEGRGDLQPFVDELRRRVDALLSPAQQNGWDVAAGVFGRLGFVYMLTGLSLPLIQPLALATSGVSILWGNYKTNPVKAGAALLNAFANIPQYGFTTNLPDGSVRYHWPSLVNSKTLKGDELRAVKELAQSDVHESTLAREVWDYAANPTSSFVKESGKEIEYYAARTMKGIDTVMGSPFHIMERWTREALFLAAYRLGRTDKLSHEAAVQKALHNVKETLGDYSKHAKPVWMQRGLGKMAFALKTFAVLVTQQTLGNLIKALPLLNKEGKKEAITKFSGIMLTMSVFAGASGVPFASTFYGMAAGIVMALGAGGDDDDKDAELRNMDNALWFRSVWLPKHIPDIKLMGVSAYDWMDRGVINAITGLDIASRIQVASTWGSDTVRPSRTTADRLTNTALDIFGGAYYGLMKQFANAKDAFEVGDTQKGKELSTPKVVRDIMKGNRLEEEGIEFNHAPVLAPEDIRKLEVWGQRIGFSPDISSVLQKEGIKGKNAFAEVQMERNELLRKLEIAEITALKGGPKGEEAREEYRRIKQEDVVAFNKKFPNSQLDEDDISRALRERSDARSNAIAGVTGGKNQVNALAPLLKQMRERVQERKEETARKKE
jgi:hypothetical protein